MPARLAVRPAEVSEARPSLEAHAAGVHGAAAEHGRSGFTAGISYGFSCTYQRRCWAVG